MTRQGRGCPRCGTKTRPGLPCPRCQRGANPEADAASRPSRLVWGIAGVAALVVALALGLPGRDGTEAVAVDAGQLQNGPSYATAAAAPALPAAGERIIQPVTAEDFSRAGAAAYQQGNLSVAFSAFEEAAREHPSDPDARNNLGQVLVRLGRPGEALPHLEAAVAGAPDRWAFRFNLARARGLTGDWAGAVGDYEQAATLFPDDYVTLYNLGRALQQTGDHARAAETLERAIALQPDDPSFQLTVAGSYEKLGRTEDAAAAYRRYLEQIPESPDAPAIQARIARLTGSAPR